MAIFLLIQISFSLCKPRLCEENSCDPMSVYNELNASISNGNKGNISEKRNEILHHTNYCNILEPVYNLPLRNETKMKQKLEIP